MFTKNVTRSGDSGRIVQVFAWRAGDGPWLGVGGFRWRAESEVSGRMDVVLSGG